MSTPQKIQTIGDLLADRTRTLLTVPEVANVLGFDVRTVRKQIALGDLPTKTLGGTRYVTRRALLELVDLADADELTHA